ncbi:hypothetical protein IEN91_05240 [Bacillus velezensis]|uniref:hypothetical protein n=1 Tax=Bacillus velezensis TaxID=492670 RepID=UPI0018C6CB9D|nr:hypothetical protein [Bacillus velezensis]QPK89843.1 hypothetical protein IEN91_05240 [Bacillus velezensis]
MDYEDLVNMHNEYHEKISKYIEEHGFSDLVKFTVESQIKWLKLKAKQHDVELYISLKIE